MNIKWNYSSAPGGEHLIGLEYILNLFNLQHIELAEKLGIKKQNINMWVKGRQNIPKKYLPVLEELFGIDASYFGRVLTEIDQLEIQKEKLKTSQRAWLKYRELETKRIATATGGTIDAVNSSGFYLDATTIRADEMENELLTR